MKRVQEVIDYLIEIVERGIEISTELIKKLKAMRDGEERAILHFAVAKSNVVAVKKLLELGFDVNAKSLKGFSPLYCAILTDNAEIAEILFKAGAENSCSSAGVSCLHTAAKVGSVKIIKFLINNSIVSIDFDAKDDLGHTPLFYAVLNKRIEVVRILIQAGCDLTITDPNGRSPLIVSILKYQAESSERYEVTKLLIDSGSDVNHRSNDTKTVLHRAAITDKDYRLIPLLLEKGADIHATDSTGFLPIHFAIATNYRAFEGLIEAGSRIDWRSTNNATILQQAMKWHDPKIIKLLLEKGASINAVDDYDLDPFISGVLGFRTPPSFFTGDSEIWFEGKLKCLKLLLKQGADINRVSSYLGTALSMALSRAEVDSRVVPFLLNHGAVLDFNDEAVRDSIVLSEKPDTSKLLIKHVALCETQSHLNELVRNFDLCKVPKELQRYYRASKDELEEMKNWMIANEEFSLYDLLAAKKIIHYVRNEHTSETLEKANHAKLFPIYIEDLRRRFEKEVKKQKRLDEARNGLSRLIKRDVSSFAVVYDNILRFLSKTDLQTLSTI